MFDRISAPLRIWSISLCTRSAPPRPCAGCLGDHLRTIRELDGSGLYINANRRSIRWAGRTGVDDRVPHHELPATDQTVQAAERAPNYCSGAAADRDATRLLCREQHAGWLACWTEDDFSSPQDARQR